MMALPDRSEVIHFRDLIAKQIGLYFDESKFDKLTKLLHHRVQSKGDEYAHYLKCLDAATHPYEELYSLVGELTVAETYFLRNLDQFKAYCEVALPDRLAANAEWQTVRVLSAGCASGEEPYSLAMMTQEHYAHALHRIEINAFDLNPAMLAKAARARYTNWSLRDFPAELKARWFKAEAECFVLDETIRKMLHFEQRNLAHEAPEFWQSASLDIVFCRNVLMYFSPEQAQAVIKRIAYALVPGGYLFLGHAETLRGLSDDFHLCHTHGTFYYQRKDELCSPQNIAPELVAHWRPAAALGDTAWVEAIQQASERIQALELPSAPVVASVNTEAQASVTDEVPKLHRALEFLHRERFDQTLEQLGILPAGLANDPDVLLLKAVSLSHSGALAAAEVTCRELLARDELNAGAYYVLALCREGTGDLSGALEQDQTAVYLDPGFAMPRLHLGLLARRQGEVALARRDLTEALLLLQKEDASRLLLFGGGFRREALIALCRAELDRLGESR